MTTSWEKTDGKHVEYLYIDGSNVTMGSHQGSGHTDCASSVSYDRFLDGAFQSDIEAIFGRGVLEEVLRAVKASR